MRLVPTTLAPNHPAAPSQRGWPALCYAARYGKTEVARALIKHKADVNVTTETPEAVRDKPTE